MIDCVTPSEARARADECLRAEGSSWLAGTATRSRRICPSRSGTWCATKVVPVTSAGVAST